MSGEEKENEAPAKKKLTLSVDEGVVKRAKSAGFNLSEVTESVLDAYAFTQENTSKNRLYQKYAELFDSMKKQLDEYGASVEVALWAVEDEEGNQSEVRVLLESDGKLVRLDTAEVDESGSEIPRPIEISEVSSSFYPPRTILENFIKAITEAREERAERIEELEMAKRMVEAIWTPASRHVEKPKQRSRGK